MPTFKYTAKRSPTVTVDGEIHAFSEDDAVHKLGQMGLAPISLEAAAAHGPAVRHPINVPSSRDRASRPADRSMPETADRVGGVRVSTQDVDRFTRQLASLVKANVPILRALSLISEQPGRPAFQAVVDDLAAQVQQGRTLSDAMSRYPTVFNNLYIAMVLAGERGGVLDTTLLRLAEHRETEQETRRNIQSAMAYPAFVIVTGIVTVVVILTYFLPKVLPVFDTLQQELPVPTRILIQTTDFLSANWYWFAIAAALLAALVTRARPGSRKKLVLDFLKLSTPIFRNMVKSAEIAKLARTLGLMIRNGISVHEGLLLATGTLDNEALKTKIEQVGADIVNKGATLSSSLARVDLLPKFVINMIGVGEEGGELPEALDEVANVYEREVQQSVKLMISLLEPLLILLIGGIVAFIVFAMLLPIFDIGGMPQL